MDCQTGKSKLSSANMAHEHFWLFNLYLFFRNIFLLLLDIFSIDQLAILEMTFIRFRHELTVTIITMHHPLIFKVRRGFFIKLFYILSCPINLVVYEAQFLLGEGWCFSPFTFDFNHLLCSKFNLALWIVDL